MPALQSAGSRQKRKRAESDEAEMQAELQQDCGQGSAQQTEAPCRLSEEQWLSIKKTLQNVKVTLLTAVSSCPSLSKAGISSKLCRP
jgi:hypothetical protein